MIIYNKKALEEGKAKTAIIKTHISGLSELSSFIKQNGVDASTTIYVSLFDKKVVGVPSVMDLREAYTRLEDIMSLGIINLWVDEVNINSNGKYITGLIFNKLFGKDSSLWGSRGVYQDKFRQKWICGYRESSVKRECDYRGIVDSEFVVDFDKANIIKVTDGNTAKDIFRKLHSENTEIFFDTETSGLRWEEIGARLLTLQLTGGNDPYTSYVFFIDHSKVETTNNLKDVCSKGMKWLLESGKAMFAHNYNFDSCWIKRCLVPDLDFYKINNYDTMLIYHFLTNSIEDVKVGLKESSFVNGVASDWETELEVAKKEICQRDKLKLDEFSYEMFDTNMLSTYAGLDTIVLAFYWKMLKELRDNHLAYPKLDIIKTTWESNWQSVMQSVQWQIWYGMPFDVKVAEKQLKEQQELVLKLETEVIEDENTRKAVDIINAKNFNKAKEAYNKKVEEALGKGKEFKGAKPQFELGKYGSIKFDEEFNSNSLAHKRVLLFEVLKLPVINKTDSGQPSCGSAEMAEYFEHYPQHKVLTHFSEIAKINKEIGTYLIPFIELSKTAFDGRIRSNFVPLNKSFRMRTTNPNILNQPKTDFKKCVKETNGNFIFQLDYAALENILALNGTKDEARLAQYNLGIEDAHSVNAIIAGKALGDKFYADLEVTKIEDVAKVKKERPNDRQNAKAITLI